MTQPSDPPSPDDPNLKTLAVSDGGDYEVEVRLPGLPGAKPLDEAAATLADGSAAATLVIDATAAPPGAAVLRRPGSSSGRPASSTNATVERTARPERTERAGQAGALLRYRDGQLTTASGDPIDLAQEVQRVVELPYTAAEVQLRLGPYDVISVIGQGGMGVVYRAYAVRLGRWCALKVMRAGEFASAIEILRFQNEAMLAARLSHPYIVPVFDAGESGEVFYFVMEFIEGSSFADLLEHPDAAAIRRGVEALAKVAEALHYAHERGIVHRDIKPDNLLLTRDGDPRITDFGIAFSVGDGEDLQGRGMVGTPYYMPPEQANGEAAAIGPRSDVYALGATLYHLLAGRPPFQGKTTMEVLLKVTRDEPESPRVVAARDHKRDIPLDLETICLKALEKESARRYTTAADLAADLRAFLEDRPIAARPIGPRERFQKLLRRNRAAFAGAAIVLSLLMLMTIAFGAVTVFNITLTNDSLRELDRQAGLNQASTLERAIRVNMLQGRADLARQLVSKLREDPDLNTLSVVRTDKTIAYTDLATRRAVEKRLKDDKVVAWAARDFPELTPSIQEVRSKAFSNIDGGAWRAEGSFEINPVIWDRLLSTQQPVTLEREINGEPNLIILKPIENSPPCQVCHGRIGKNDYGTTSNNVRAVVVVHRSRRGVEEQIQRNELVTLGIGLATTGLFGGLLFLFGRLFGIGLRPRRFGK